MAGWPFIQPSLSSSLCPSCLQQGWLCWKWLSWVGEGWDTRQREEEEKGAITAGDRCARSKSAGWRRARTAGGWAGRRWKTGWSWEVKENEKMAKEGSMS